MQTGKYGKCLISQYDGSTYICQCEFRKLEYRLAWFWIKHPAAALSVVWGQIKLGRISILVKLVYRFISLLFSK
jgi:hypothetical protein